MKDQIQKEREINQLKTNFMTKQEIRNKLLREVIEFVKSQPTYPRDCFMRDVYKKLQSLIVEEPKITLEQLEQAILNSKDKMNDLIKDEEIKAGDDVEYAFNNEDFRPQSVTFHVKSKVFKKFICEDSEGFIFCADFIRKPLSLQQKAEREAKRLLQIYSVSGNREMTDKRILAMLVEILKDPKEL